MIVGGDWNDLGDVRIPRWTNSLTHSEQVKEQVDDPRPVNVTISSWVGMSAGAKHYYLVIEEEPNHWWDENKNDWRRIVGDSSSKGFVARLDCYSESQAKQLARAIINTVFGTPRSKQRKLWKIPRESDWH